MLNPRRVAALGYRDTALAKFATNPFLGETSLAPVGAAAAAATYQCPGEPAMRLQD